MVEVKPFRLGVVEGFFGRSWSWEARTHYARFLSGSGFSTYLYAPKNDEFFRKNWSQPCPRSHHDALAQLAAHYRQAGIEFGIGLSPYELYLDFSQSGQETLKRKLDEINAINPDTLCILFDDMKGDVEDLGPKQLQIMDFITRFSTARQYIFCPTYYSDDLLLNRHFGERPENYLEEIGAQLDSRVDIFWTGPKIFSEEFPEEHLLDVAEKLQRKPLLWDNYPVNDSKALTDFLRLRPVENRGPELMSLTQGHIANPMNQAWLSQVPLYCLAKLYLEKTADPEKLLGEACDLLSPKKMGPLLAEDISTFQEVGLAGLSEEQKAVLAERYSPYRDHPMVQELLDWLQGGYAFDPACLT